MKAKENLTAYIAWLSICIIWGTTYLAIRIGVEDLPPILFAGFRWLIAGPILFLILRMKKLNLPKKEDLIHLAVVGILLLGGGNVFVVFAEQWVPSGLTALLITTVPFWIVGIEAFLPQGRKINIHTMLGLLLGLAGMVIMFGGDLKSLFNIEYLGGVLSLMIAVISWSVGTLYSKYRKVSAHPLMSASIQMIIAGVALTLLGLFFGEWNKFNFTNESLVAFLYLVVFGSLIGYASYIYAVAHLPVSFVSTYAYVNPVIALFLGWLVLNEKITIWIFVAAAVILFGVALVKKGSSKPLPLKVKE